MSELMCVIIVCVPIEVVVADGGALQRFGFRFPHLTTGRVVHCFARDPLIRDHLVALDDVAAGVHAGLLEVRVH